MSKAEARAIHQTSVSTISERFFISFFWISSTCTLFRPQKVSFSYKIEQFELISMLDFVRGFENQITYQSQGISNVHFIQDTLEKLGTIKDSPIDTVLFLAGYSLVEPQLKELLTTLQRVLKPAGQLLLASSTEGWVAPPSL